MNKLRKQNTRRSEYAQHKKKPAKLDHQRKFYERNDMVRKKVKKRGF